MNKEQFTTVNTINDILPIINDKSDKNYLITPLTKTVDECHNIRALIGDIIGAGAGGTVHTYKSDTLSYVIKVMHDFEPIATRVCVLNEKDNLKICEIACGVTNNSSIMLEFIIGCLLGESFPDAFPKYHELFTCDDKIYMIMDKVSGMTLRDFFKKNSGLKREDKLEKFKICLTFKLLYYLMLANEKLGFSHNDLTADNIMVVRKTNLPLIETFEINNNKYILPPCKYTFKIIDFGLSTLNINDRILVFSKAARNKYKFIPNSTSGDACRIIKNNSYRPAIIDTSLYISNCYFRGITVVPPYPTFTIRSLFAKGLLNELIHKNI